MKTLQTIISNIRDLPITEGLDSSNSFLSGEQALKPKPADGTSPSTWERKRATLLVPTLARNGCSTSQVPRTVVLGLLSPLLALQELNTKTAPPSPWESLSELRPVTVLQAYLLFFNLLPLGLLLPVKCRWDAIVNVESDCDPRKLKEHTKTGYGFN